MSGIQFCTGISFSSQLLQLFSDMSKTSLYEDFIKKQLGVLIDYDAQNHTQLLSTLEIYLKNNCNLLHTADELFTHRNTIKYRLKRIEELLHRNMEDSAVLLNLNVALYLKNYVLPVIQMGTLFPYKSSYKFHQYLPFPLYSLLASFKIPLTHSFFL